MIDTLNFVEGQGISIQTELHPGDPDTLDIEIASTIDLSSVTTDPADDTRVWMPLTTVIGGVPELVWDDDDSLIPTLIPLEA